MPGLQEIELSTFKSKRESPKGKIQAATKTTMAGSELGGQQGEQGEFKKSEWSFDFTKSGITF